MQHPRPQTAGIDIAKDQLDACLYPDGVTRHFPNDAKGHRALIAWLSGQAIQRVVVEPTGAYHRGLERSLARATCRWRRSIPATPAASQKPWDSSPKLIGSMQPFWRALERCSSRQPGLCSAPLWMP